MKNLLDVSACDARDIVSVPLFVCEMLDMSYFKVSVFDGSFTIYRKSGHVVDDVDIICDDICSRFRSAFVSRIWNTISKIEGIDGCVIGFHYLPENITKCIDYNTLERDTIILGTVYGVHGVVFDSIVSAINECGVYGFPVISDSVELYDGFFDMDKDGRISFLKEMVCGGKTFTGIGIDNVEGVAIGLCPERSLYSAKFKNKENRTDSEGSLIYRNEIIRDFLAKVANDSAFMDSVSSRCCGYIEAMCRMFTEYVDRSDIFSRFDISESDIEAPCDGYRPRMDIESVPLIEAKLLCRYDSRYANVLRILLYAFRNDRLLNSDMFRNDYVSAILKHNGVL